MEEALANYCEVTVTSNTLTEAGAINDCEECLLFGGIRSSIPTVLSIRLVSNTGGLQVVSKVKLSKMK